MNKPNFTVMKKLIISNRGHFRFYSPYLTYAMLQRLRRNYKRPKMKAPTFTLDPNDNRFPNVSYIRTEKELCWLLLTRFGEGDYHLLSHIKKHKGGWTFWKGQITREGFCFERRERLNSREITILQKELSETNDPKTQQDIIDEIEFEKEFLSSFANKFGFIPYLQPSGRRGEFIQWSEPEPEIIQKENKDEGPVWPK